MKTFDFIQAVISHNLKDPHSKALEPDCLSPLHSITTQSLEGEKRRDDSERKEAALPNGTEPDHLSIKTFNGFHLSIQLEILMSPLVSRLS